MRGDTEKFLSEIEAFLKATGMSATQFGACAMGDTKLVSSMRKGRKDKKPRRLRDATVVRLREWMQAVRGAA